MVTAPINTCLNSGSLSCVATVGTPRWPHETTGIARADWRWGVRLPVPLAVLFAGCGSPLPAGLIIWAISGWLCFAIRILVISRVKAAGSSTNALTSASGLSRTMAMSISPPSFWIRAGRPACICARIATALFSHRVRSHSSKALCARVPVCGGHFELPVSSMHG